MSEVSSDSELPKCARFGTGNKVGEDISTLVELKIYQSNKTKKIKFNQENLHSFV